MIELFENWRSWAWSGLWLATAVAFFLVVHAILFRVAARVVRLTGGGIDDAFVRHSRRPFRLMIPLLGALLVLPAMPLPLEAISLLRHVIGLGLIAGFAWLLVSLTHVVDDYVSRNYPLEVKENLEARQVHTQIRVLRRVASVFIAIVTLAVMLMTFPSIRELGASILASAGLAGLVVGMAARPTLANLIAGVQLAMTTPIRIDDVVIVEGEWGRIEEIRTTFVVVRIWDLRRLVVPLTYFIENPFQNWTRESADLLGTVFLYTDYTVPVDEVRARLHDILKSSGLWDGKVWNLQVTNASERTMELRALMSAPDSGTAWDLRCQVREKLIAFLQERYPQSLPRTRAEIETAVPVD